MRYSDRGTINPVEWRREVFARSVIGKLYRDARVWPSEDHVQPIREAFIEATAVTIPDSLVEDLEKVHYAGGFYSRKAIIEQALIALGFEVRK